MHNQISDSEKQAIGKAAAFLSQTLGDAVHLASNQTQLERIYQGSDIELGAFMDRARQAYSMTIHKLAGIRKPCAYMFRILESLLNEPIG